MCAPIKMNFLFEKGDCFLKLVRLVTIRTKCCTVVTAYVHVFMAYSIHKPEISIEIYYLFG